MSSITRMVLLLTALAALAGCVGKSPTAPHSQAGRSRPQADSTPAGPPVTDGVGIMGGGN